MTDVKTARMAGGWAETVVLTAFMGEFDEFENESFLARPGTQGFIYGGREGRGMSNGRNSCCEGAGVGTEAMGAM